MEGGLQGCAEGVQRGAGVCRRGCAVRGCAEGVQTVQMGCRGVQECAEEGVQRDKERESAIGACERRLSLSLSAADTDRRGPLPRPGVVPVALPVRRRGDDAYSHAEAQGGGAGRGVQGGGCREEGAGRGVQGGGCLRATAAAARWRCRELR